MHGCEWIAGTGRDSDLKRRKDLAERSIQDTLETLLQRTVDRPPTREDLDASVAELGIHLGIDGMVLDDDGVAEITVEDDVDVTLMHLPGAPGLVLAAEVANSRDLGHDELRRILQSNMSWDLTLGGCFAMLPESDEVLLCRVVLSVGREASDLDQEIDAFTDVVRGWREVLAERLNAVDEAPDMPGGPPTELIRG